MNKIDILFSTSYLTNDYSDFMRKGNFSYPKEEVFIEMVNVTWL